MFENLYLFYGVQDVENEFSGWQPLIPHCYIEWRNPGTYDWIYITQNHASAGDKQDTP